MAAGPEYGAAIGFRSWISSIEHLLRPPVGNKLMFGAGQLKVMIVGGPNRREDFHIEEGEEFFYMIKGDMRVDVMEQGRKREIPIREGEIFVRVRPRARTRIRRDQRDRRRAAQVLPPRIPHSPQRFPDTIGLVIERERLPGEMDGLRWCGACASAREVAPTSHCARAPSPGM